MRECLVFAQRLLDAAAEPQATGLVVLVVVAIAAVKFRPRDEVGAVHLLGRCALIAIAGVGLNAIPRYLSLLLAPDFGTPEWFSRVAKPELAGMVAAFAIVAAVGTTLALWSAFRPTHALAAGKVAVADPKAGASAVIAE